MPTVTITFPGALTGVSFAAGGTVAGFLTTNPTVPISLAATGLTGDNLTSEGLLPGGGPTVWRITNFGLADNTTTLSKFGGGFSQLLSLPANSLTFVRGGDAGTYKLTGGINNTKASEPQVNGIRNFLLTDSYFITGSGFNDTLTGGDLADTITGGAGNDSLTGGNGADILTGELGNDTLTGGLGADTLTGGAGNDSLTGGDGADRFVFNSSSEALDTITDFNVAAGQDIINVSATGFGGSLVAGTLSGIRFRSGAGVTTANSPNQRFIYNTTDGGLWFDVDGNTPGGIASVQIATLSNLVTITNTNIVVI
ncbi:MAG: calcium-binding protein [Microcystis sp. M015S2]|uniref:calcium-binding protein n=1 Tax=unclassified Microcystis TaxID=2643300 RepID=UPI002586E5C1|nr:MULTISPECIES: calcium-binding protein [unclassified Microcystis]MCA2709127.1 calcium-binding protein [Microcystis sp. M025S2]MCA2742670.1 calcium-binding protein [Microcystis sp. M015S2]MCA2758357.1 calcium-binding protein [Microcystis sp. M145S2]